MKGRKHKISCPHHILGIEINICNERVYDPISSTEGIRSCRATHLHKEEMERETKGERKRWRERQREKERDGERDRGR